MQSENYSTSIIGGTYTENCNIPCVNQQLFGSGLRALALFHELYPERPVCFKTCCSSQKEKLMRAFHSRANTKIDVTKNVDIQFFYEHPFRVSEIYPRMDTLAENKQTREPEGDNILLHGMMEANVKVHGNIVIYDPQTANEQYLFSRVGSKASQLIYVLNSHEAKVLSGKELIFEQRDFFFDIEKCHALIIKNGANGAYLFRGKSDDGIVIPVYKTNKVWSIGTGDIFTAYFAFKVFDGADIQDAAISASKAVACYSQKGTIEGITRMMETFNFAPIIPQKQGQIYLAGPFFSVSQLWLVGEFYKALKSEGIKVFSPLHDVGIGNAEEVTDKDVEGLNKSDVVLAIVDSLDSGTLFECGYAVAKGKKVVAFVQNESEKALQMLKGTGCDLEEDFTTAVYKSIWYAIQ